jgi:two-component system, NtrC family, nitrogen regulation sensor histidine kinase NtrY
MVMRNTRRFLFLVALLSLGVILVANFFLDDSNEEEKLIKPVSQKIHQVEKEFDEDFLQLLLKNRPEAEFSFTNLTIDSHHSYYLFTESGNLVYWSDFNYMPDFEWINSKTSQRILEDKRGIFFTKVRRFSRNNQGYWMIQLYPLYFKEIFKINTLKQVSIQKFLSISQSSFLLNRKTDCLKSRAPGVIFGFQFILILNRLHWSLLADGP